MKMVIEISLYYDARSKKNIKLFNCSISVRPKPVANYTTRVNMKYGYRSL